MDDPNGTICAKASGGKTLASIISSTVAFALARGMTMDEIERVTGLKGPNLVDPAGEAASGERGCRDRRWPVNAGRPGMRAATQPSPLAKSVSFFSGLLNKAPQERIFTPLNFYWP